MMGRARRKPRQDPTGDVARWQYLDQHATLPRHEGEPVTTEQLKGLVTFAESRHSAAPPEVTVLIGLLLEHPEVNYKDVCARLLRALNSRPHVLRADANFYAREELSCRLRRDAIPYWVCFSIYRSGDSDVFRAAWRLGNKHGFRIPRQAGGGTGATTLSDALTGSATAASSDSVAAESLPPRFTEAQWAPSLHLSKLIRRYVRDQNTPWLDAHDPDPTVWSEIVGRGSVDQAADDKKEPSCTFIRCLPVLPWCQYQARAVARTINERGGFEHATFVSVKSGHPLPDGLGLIARPATRDKDSATIQVLVVLIEGYNAIEQVHVLDAMARARRTSVGRLIVFGFAAMEDMQHLQREGWNLIEVVQPRLPLRVDDVEPVPDELRHHHSPLGRLLTRPEPRDVFKAAAKLPEASKSPTELQRWRNTLEGLRSVIELNGVRGHEAIRALATSWGQRFSDSRRSGWARFSSTSVEELNRSGLFLPEMRYAPGHREEPLLPVAGAIGAFLDGIRLGEGVWADPSWMKLFRAMVAAARSPRRLTYFRNHAELAAWLALLTAVHEADEQTVERIVGAVARQDIALALDLHMFRVQLHGDTPSSVVSQLIDHGYRHRNALPFPFEWQMDLYELPSRPQLRSDPDLATALRICDATKDLDVIASTAVSCAIVCEGGRHPIRSFLKKVLPPTLLQRISDLGSRLRESTIDAADGWKVSASAVSVDNLATIFPGARRCQRGTDKVAVLSWLSAHLLADACGGRLPVADEIRDLPTHDIIQKVVLQEPDELPDSPDAQMLVPTRKEWLELPGEVQPIGRDFVADYPRFREQTVQYANWFRAETPGSRAFVDVPLDTPGWPHRWRLAACRVVFPPS